MYEVLLELDDLLETLTYWLSFAAVAIVSNRLLRSMYGTRPPSRKQPGRSPGKERTE